MKTLNQISQEKYGKDYNHLPDDGAEQDFVQGEYTRLTATKKVHAVKPVCNDLSEQAMKEFSDDAQANRSEQPGKATPWNYGIIHKYLASIYMDLSHNGDA